jgi:hypothetical protein
MAPQTSARSGANGWKKQKTVEALRKSQGILDGCVTGATGSQTT